MDSDVSTGVNPPSAEMNTLLDRLLAEVEGEETGTPPPLAVPSAPPPTTAQSAAVSAQAPPAQVSSGPAPPLGGGASPLGSLLANPALLTALPTLAENIGPLLGSLSGGTGTAPTATRPHVIDRHTALLCAVKPYLSPQRREAAETVIRICRIWDALERSGISLSGLLSGLGGGNSAGTAISVAAPTDGEVT